MFMDVVQIELHISGEQLLVWAMKGVPNVCPQPPCTHVPPKCVTETRKTYMGLVQGNCRLE